MQFHAQDTHYQRQYPTAERSLVLLDQVPVGRLYLDRRADGIRIIDIALLPEHRGGGLGTALLRSILDEATARGVPVRLHVEPHNPAARLYTRLGFLPIGEAGVYQEMERPPPSLS